jgi:hypothetical protein
MGEPRLLCSVQETETDFLILTPEQYEEWQLAETRRRFDDWIDRETRALRDARNGGNQC